MATTARTKTDVEQQDRRQRLWDSLDYSYGKKRQDSDESFARSYSQADRQMLGRGMQRSSYGAQTLANINKQANDARQDIYDAQIADYQARLTEIEDKEQEDARWQQQFEYQQQRDAVGDNQWQMQFDYGKERDTVGDQQWQKQFDYQQGRDKVGDEQWQKQFNENVRQFNVLHPQDTGSGGGGGGYSGGSRGGSRGGGGKKNSKNNQSGDQTGTSSGGLFSTLFGGSNGGTSSNNGAYVGGASTQVVPKSPYVGAASPKIIKSQSGSKDKIKQ